MEAKKGREGFAGPVIKLNKYTRQQRSKTKGIQVYLINSESCVDTSIILSILFAIDDRLKLRIA